MRFVAGLLIATYWTTLVLNAAEPDNHGSLVIVGGALRYTQTDVWKAVVELAGGTGAKIAVFPTASSDPLKYGSRSVAALHQAGADAFLLPLWGDRSDVDIKQAVVDPKLIEQVKAAGGVYFIGGAQSRITTALGSSAGERTPMLEAIWEVYRRGGVVAGSSAGAAAMSRMMIREPPSVLKSMQDGLSLGKDLAPGLGFLDPAWFVDQHCLARGRFGRTLVAMQTLAIKFGVGVDENTAVIVRQGRNMSVIGYKGAIVMDLSQATSDPTIHGFNLKNARLTYLDRGDAMDLQTLELTPSAEKKADQFIDPGSPAFHPSRDVTLFANDILGNLALPDLLGKLIDNKNPEAIGLAFDGAAARQQPTRGFEFRFYRAADSVGWFTSASGAGAYTVANIRLDIRPVEITGPLYK
ncbi:MAG: cyanophycinase [Planctomycetia bacterium]|nr:cyanophycinase [Planctomycetia bacterium]